MNKTGQFQVINIFIQVVFGLFMWATGFAEWITYWTQAAITTNSLTGLTAFFLAYMNLWIFLAFALLTSIGSAVMEGT